MSTYCFLRACRPGWLGTRGCCAPGRADRSLRNRPGEDTLSLASGRQAQREIFSISHLGHPDILRKRLVWQLLSRLLPHRIQQLAPVAPGRVKIYDHHLVRAVLQPTPTWCQACMRNKRLSVGATCMYSSKLLQSSESICPRWGIPDARLSFTSCCLVITEPSSP